MEDIALRRRVRELEAKVSGLDSDASRYRALIKARHDLIVELDNEGRISAVSPALLELSGYAASECLGRSTYSFTTASHAELLRGQTPTLFDWAARRHPFELPLVCKNGSELWLEGNIYAFTTDAGQSGMFCLYRDVTESKVLERERLRLGDGAALALALGDRQAFEYDFIDGIVWQSPGLPALLGLDQYRGSLEELSAWLGNVLEADRAKITELLDAINALKPAAGKSETRRIEFRVQLADGSRRHLQAALQWDCRVAGRWQRLVGSVGDITEQVHLRAHASAAEPLESAQDAQKVALSHAKQRLELALSLGEIGIAQWSKLQGWTKVSPRYRAALGLAAHEDPPELEAFMRQVHVQDRDHVLARTQLAFETETPELQRYRFHRRDGVLAYLESATVYKKSNTGELESLMVVMRDQTEYRAVEQSLNSSVERLSVAMHLSEVEFLEIEQYSGRCEATSGFLRLLGLESSEAADWLKCIHPDDHALIPRPEQRSGSYGPVRLRVSPNLQRGTTLLWIEASFAYSVDESKQLRRSTVAIRDVNEQVLIEHEIRRQAQLSRAVIENSPDGIVRLDRQRRLLMVNPALCRMMGFTQEQLLGKTLSELPLSAARAQEFEGRIRRLFETGVGEEFELHFQNMPDPPWLLVRYVAEANAQGEVDYLLGFFRDVNQLKQAQTEALANARQLGQILETAEEGIVVTDTNNNFVFNNQKLEQIFGYLPNELLGKHESALQVDASEAQWLQRVQERMEGLSESYTHHFKRKDGSLVLCWVNAKPLLDERGQYMGTLAMLTDVTELERTERELRQSLEWLEFSMESAQIAGMDVDVEHGFCRSTVLFRDWFGIPEEGGGSPLVNWMQAVHELDRARIQEQVHAILERGSSARADFRIIDNDGELRWLYAVIVSVRNVAGEIARVVMTVVDISERQKLEREREDLQRHLAQSQREESLGTLSAGLSHDLNNLLTTAFGHVDLARMVVEDADAQNSLDLVGESLTQMTALSQQLLAYAGKSPLNLKLMDLNEALEAIRSIMAVSVGKKAHFVIDLCPDRLMLMGEALQLQQIALNLLLNATEALKDSGGEIKLSTRQLPRERLAPTVRARLPASVHEVAVLSISDSGAGMDEETKLRLFEPFYSTKGQGRGLGLSVVAGIVRAHRGHIEIENKSQLTRFSVYLPLQATHGVPVVSGAVDAEKSLRTVPMPLVLVVDDEPTLRNLISRTLNTHGFETLVASHGDEALSLLDQHRQIGLVLLDLTMPNKDGIEVYAEMLQRFPDKQVVLMSGYNEQSVASRLNPGSPIPAFLHKPFRANELLAIIQKTLLDR